MEIITKTAAGTQKVGGNLVADILKEKRGETATVILLKGELGSGKTTFVQGMAKALGIPRRVVSPTFILMREYELKLTNFRRFYHIDLYKIKITSETESLGLVEIFADQFNIVCIEWPELIIKLLPAGYISVEFEVNTDNSYHTITIHKG